MVKKKKCTIGYNCSRACINREKVCRVERLGGQSIRLMDYLSDVQAVSKGKEVKTMRPKPIIKPRKSDSDIATDIAKAIRVEGKYNLPIQVKGNVIRLQQGRNGIITVERGKAKTYKLTKSLQDVIKQFE